MVQHSVDLTTNCLFRQKFTFQYKGRGRVTRFILAHSGTVASPEPRGWRQRYHQIRKEQKVIHHFPIVLNMLINLSL